MAFSTPSTANFSRSTAASVRLETAISDYDFLRATYEALLRARDADTVALEAAFGALDAAHERLRAAHVSRLRLSEAELAVH
ncbi:MAG: hypothetical protein KA795_12790 [Burkholderiaceae bacterium]|nr:hypothetical protein [Burkholderiaceae bacterium]